MISEVCKDKKRSGHRSNHPGKGGNTTNRNSFKIEYKLEGQIESIDGDKISAKMYNPDSDQWGILHFALNDIDKTEHKNVFEGSALNVFIGKERINGTDRKAKRFIFRKFLYDTKVINSILESMYDNPISQITTEL